MGSKFSSTSKLQKKSYWSGRLALILIGAGMTTWGWLLVHRGVDAYPTTDRYGRPTIAYSRMWSGFGVFLVVLALVPLEKIFRGYGNAGQ